MRRILAALVLAVSPTALQAAGVSFQDSTVAAVAQTQQRTADFQASGEQATAQSGQTDSALSPSASVQGTVTQRAERRADGFVARVVDRLARLERRMPWSGIPLVRDVPPGPQVVAAGDTVTGPIASRGAPLDVYGVVNGDAVAYEGDIILHPGSTVTGDAIAVLGQVRLLGGAVGGEVRSVRGALAPIVSSQVAAATPRATVRDRLGLVVGWLTVLILIGVGVLVFASGPLDGVVEALHGGFARSLLLGVAGQLAVLPAVLMVVVALAVTVIGVLLIPFAIVAIALATAGLMMLGFLAVTSVTGSAVTGGDSRRRMSERGAALRALFVGIVIFIAVWLAAALLTPLPAAAAVARGVAFVLTWVAVTAGFGAALRSRAGTRRPTPPQEEPEPEDEISWLTPTPIGGVKAVRRPTTHSR